MNMMRIFLSIWCCLLLLMGCESHEAEEQQVVFHSVDLGKEANVSCFEVEPNGSMWIGLDGQGLAYKVADGKPCTFYDKLSGTLPSDVVLCHFKDSKGRLWFGTFGNGMFYWDESAFHLPEQEGLRGKELEYVSGFLEDVDGALWIATQTNGIACCDSTGKVEFFTEDNSDLQTNWIADIATFDRQSIYVASGWGLFLIDAHTKKIEPVVDKEGHSFLEKQLARVLYADKSYRLWIGTKTGLYIYNRNTREYVRLTTDDGMADNYVKAIAPDTRGNMWVTSDHSVTLIMMNKKQEGVQYLCRAFSDRNTLGDAVLHVRAAVCTPDGNMMFGTSKGCIVAKTGVSQSSLVGSGTLVPWLAALLVLVLLVAFQLLYHQRKKRRLGLAPVYAEIEPKKMEISSVDEQLKEKAIRVVEENMGNSEFSVEDLSVALGMSRGHLYKRLVAITGKTPIEFIRVIRVKQGRQMLEKSGESISQIAWLIGMSPKQFAKYFKEEYGMLPSDFIKKMGAE